MKTEIVRDALKLRRYEKSFAPLLYEAAIESRADASVRWLPWCHANYSLSDSESFIERCLTNWAAENEFNFGIFDAETDKFLGGVGLNRRDRQHHFMNLGYWVRASERKRGAASRAARLLAQAAFEELPLSRIEILTPVENFASQKTAQRAGAAREGVLRQRLSIGGRAFDAVMFSFVREDFAL